MPALPEGLVTFLFTDIEGSTRLWDRHAAAMGESLERHNTILRRAIERERGVVFKTVGDAFCAAFASAGDAATAAVAAQRALVAEPWPAPVQIKVRMALHSGVAEARGNDYFGPPLNRTARLVSAGHGGQVLLSHAAREQMGEISLPGVSLRDMGERRLKDLLQPERIYQLNVAGLPSEFPPLQTLDVRASNLPPPDTSFVGRDREVGELVGAIEGARMVTLTGAGGIGKTRLSVQTASTLLDTFPDGVHFVSLAALQDASLLPKVVATSLEVAERAGTPIVDALVSALRTRESLLILDNCEHLVAAAASLCASLLSACPKIRIVATSREGLRVPGEALYRVPPLAVPPVDAPASVESVLAHPSVKLFVDRARLVKTGFAVTASNAAEVAAICRRLDGIPLAIELAAACLRTMSVADANRRLDERFRLLTAGQRTALPRQQTLRGTIDWSYGLLQPQEQTLLRRLSVFSGGWSMSAAEAVCSGEGIRDSEVAAFLGALVEKSLVIVDDQGETTRLRMLQTIQQYAADRLLEAGDRNVWSARHLSHFLADAERAQREAKSAHDRSWLDHLASDHENFRSALATATTQDGDVEAGLRLASSLLQFWGVRGHLTEGRTLLAKLLDDARSSSRTVARARALHAAGVLSRQQGDLEASRTALNEGLAIMRSCGDRAGTATVLAALGITVYEQGDYALAREIQQESLDIRESLGDRSGVGQVLNNLGNNAAQRGDFEGAKEHFERSLALCRELRETRGAAIALNNLGMIAYNRDDLPGARELYRECLAILEGMGDRRGIATSLNNLGAVAQAQGDFDAAMASHAEALGVQRELIDRPGIAESLEGLAAAGAGLGEVERAALWWGCAERIRESIGSPLHRTERVRYDDQVAKARSAASHPDAFEREWRRGRDSPADDIVERVLSDRSRRPAD